jgi:hypothetical protein
MKLLASVIVDDCGIFHNADGPAVERQNNNNEFWFYEKQCTMEEMNDE